MQRNDLRLAVVRIGSIELSYRYHVIYANEYQIEVSHANADCVTTRIRSRTSIFIRGLALRK